MFSNATRVNRFVIVSFVLLLLVIVGALVAWEFALGPRAAFRRLVVDRIPHSVRNIKVDRCQLSTRTDRLYSAVDVHAHVLRFDIGEDDVSRIIAEHGLRTVGWEKVQSYEGEIICHPWMIKLYMSRDPNEDKDAMYPGCPRPSWFDLDSWFDLPNWQGEPRLRTALNWRASNGYEELTFLYYNEQLGSAFFIKWESSEF
jgi:hypothetical protein